MEMKAGQVLLKTSSEYFVSQSNQKYKHTEGKAFFKSAKLRTRKSRENSSRYRYLRNHGSNCDTAQKLITVSHLNSIESRCQCIHISNHTRTAKWHFLSFKKIKIYYIKTTENVTETGSCMHVHMLFSNWRMNMRNLVLRMQQREIFGLEKCLFLAPPENRLQSSHIHWKRMCEPNTWKFAKNWQCAKAPISP